MRSRFHYVRPKGLQEALDILHDRGSQAKILGGGTDLMIEARKGRLSCALVVDVSRLEDLRVVETQKDFLSVGSALTYSELINNEKILSYAPVLALAANTVGSVQIRNAGTLGGNVANASPAADGVTALIALDAQVEIVSRSSTRTEHLGEFITGPYRTSLKPGEIITRFLLRPHRSDHRYTYQRIARRKALSIARINIALLGGIAKKGIMADMRLSVGSVLPQPSRMIPTEEMLNGSRPSRELFFEAARTVSQEMLLRSGQRPSFEYKRPAVEGLVMRALMELFPC